MTGMDPRYAAFERRLRERFEAGAREYGERSWTRTPDELLGEIEEELLDVAGWAIILYDRLRRAREALASLRDAAE